LGALFGIKGHAPLNCLDGTLAEVGLKLAQVFKGDAIAQYRSNGGLACQEGIKGCSQGINIGGWGPLMPRQVLFNGGIACRQQTRIGFSHTGGIFTGNAKVNENHLIGAVPQHNVIGLNIAVQNPVFVH